MINVSNFTRKNTPPWRLAEPAGPVRPPGPNAPDQAADKAADKAADAAAQAGSGSRRVRLRRILLIVGRVLLNWLAAIPRRLGDRLFAMNDTEAYWRGWQSTRTHGGLGPRSRRYRDPRFDTQAECSKCRGTGRTGTGLSGTGADGAAYLPCVPCLGTGRITLGEVS